MNTKRSAWGLILLIASILLSSCNETVQYSSTNGAKQNIVSHKVKLKVFADEDSWIDMKTSAFTGIAEEKFNIQFDWQIAPKDGAAEKRQISLASGDYPDLYLLIPWVDRFQPSELLKYSKQGVILPLNDLIRKYAPNIQAALDKYSFYKEINTAPDGNIYGLTQLSDCYHCSYPNKYWINAKWLNKLNLGMPKTTEEYKEVLKAFKTRDPNGNGHQDEVPLSGSIEEEGTHIIPFLMNGFIYDDDKNYLIINDAGQVEFAPSKPEWKQGLQYIKSLYMEGLIDPGAFMQNWDALKKIGDNADAELLGSAAAMHPDLFITTGITPGSEPLYSTDYVPLPPLTGPNSAYATYNYSISDGATFVLTNKASKEAQIAAIQMLDYMFTEEGQLVSSFGKEGLDWRKPLNGELALQQGVTPIFFQIQLRTNEKPHNSSWGATAQYFQPREFRDARVQGIDINVPADYERRLQEATYLYENKQPKKIFPNWAFWVDPTVVNETVALKLNIKNYVDQNALQFIIGAKDLDKDWDAYLNGLDKLKLQHVLEMMQHIYDVYMENKK